MYKQTLFSHLFFRKLILLLSLLNNYTNASAQAKEGTVFYLKIINQHKTQFFGQPISRNIPEFRVENFVLSFKDSISVYGKLAQGKTEVPVMGLKQEDIFDVYYKNNSIKEFKAFKIFQNAKYLVSDKIEPQKWKLTGEVKIILGHTCYKAVRIVSRQSESNQPLPKSNPGKNRPDMLIEAWYSTHIKIPVGPDSFDQLPGLILEVNVDQGALTYIASKIVPDTNPLILLPPKIGKIISNQSFMKLLLRQPQKRDKK